MLWVLQRSSIFFFRSGFERSTFFSNEIRVISNSLEISKRYFSTWEYPKGSNIPSGDIYRTFFLFCFITKCYKVCNDFLLLFSNVFGSQTVQQSIEVNYITSREKTSKIWFYCLSAISMAEQ